MVPTSNEFAHADIAATLLAREPIFHRPELGTARADFEAQTAPDFCEVGASGRCYSREFVLDLVTQRHATPHDDPWKITDFACRTLGEATYAVTYLLHQGERRTRRLTLWSHQSGRWVILYHQGTLVAPDVP